RGGERVQAAETPREPAKKRSEPGEEVVWPAVPPKQIPPQTQIALVQMKVAAVAMQVAFTVTADRPSADAAGKRCNGRRDHDRDDVQLVRRRREDRRRNQNRFAGHEEADVLERDD